MDLRRIVEGVPETRELYLEDSYLKEAKARILRAVKEKGSRYYLVLDETIFHPLSGGQATDKGFLEGEGFRFEVKKALKSGKHVIIYGKSLEGVPTEGAEVVQKVQWERRYLIMRLHTAGHVLDRAVSELIGQQVHTLGAFHGPPDAYVEYDKLEADPEEIEELANEILDDREVIVRYVTPQELDDVVYGAPNLGRLPPAEVYRVIDIVGINAIPCTGTHVKRTSEVGGIRVIGVEEIEGGFRLHYWVD